MILLKLAGISLLAAVIVVAEWTRSGKKERTAMIGLTALGWCLSALLLLFPGMPGPVDLMDFLAKPLAKWLK